jgi:hypothetical protein
MLICDKYKLLIYWTLQCPLWSSPTSSSWKCKHPFVFSFGMHTAVEEGYGLVWLNSPIREIIDFIDL